MKNREARSHWAGGLHQATDDMASCLLDGRTRCTGLMAYTRLQMTWRLACLRGGQDALV